MKKRLWIILLCAALVCGCAVGAAAQTAADVNGDGAVNAVDALLVLRIAVDRAPEATPAQRTAADRDGNGTVDARDALAVLLLAVGRDVQPVEQPPEQPPEQAEEEPAEQPVTFTQDELGYWNLDPVSDGVFDNVNTLMVRYALLCNTYEEYVAMLQSNTDLANAYERRYSHINPATGEGLTYDRTFFETHSLLLVATRCEGSGSIRYVADAVTLQNQTLTVAGRMIYPGYGTCDMAKRIYPVELTGHFNVSRIRCLTTVVSGTYPALEPQNGRVDDQLFDRP